MPEAVLPGGCEALLGDESLTAAIGAFDITPPSELWHVGFETVGGVECTLTAPESWARVFVLPEEEAAAIAESYRDPVCAQVYDDVECTAAGSAGEAWILVMSSIGYVSADTPTAVPARLLALRDALVVRFDGAESAGVDSSATTAALPLDCEGIAARLDVGTLLDSAEIYESRIEEGPGPLARRLADALGTSGRCDWSELDDFREFGLVVFPDAHWAWDRESEALAGSTQTTVAGHPARVTEMAGGRQSVLVSGGTNLLWVSGARLPDGAVVDAASAYLG
ncbi:hypothetical protein N3K63_14880 [Microbacterium sp. W1N]|uniref:hypothetical protein n=1 Tax=Microbacterium festucae TaxID=2977531 RepID=UPI0021BEC90B|nr:hypothetical protein [Microbacterium festucae]MCT9821569.1 hypothetical protein [Microbacterium festucae]